MKASYLLLTFFIGALAGVPLSQAVNLEVPGWVNSGCVNVTCTMPAEVFDVFKIGQAWYEKGTTVLCSSQLAGQSGCTNADPDFRVWIELTSNDTSKLVFVSDATLQGPAGAVPLNVGIPGDGVWPKWAYGGPFSFGLPPVAQELTFPPVDPLAANLWWDERCAIISCQGPVTTMDQATFNALLAASPFATAVHSVTLTMLDGTQFTGMTGPPQ